MAARGRREPRGHGAALNHGEDDSPRHGLPRQSARAIDALKQWHLRVLDGGRVEIRRERVLGPVMGRHVVPLPAFLMEAQPPPRPLRKIVLPLHADDRAHPGEAEDHHADQRAVAQPNQRPRGRRPPDSPGGPA